MKIILTGATGYVGEGVMLELLRSGQVEKVLSVSRRPAFMRWAKGQRRIQKMQYWFIPFYPISRLLGGGNSMTEVALSMIACSRNGYPKFAIGPRDIIKLAKTTH